MTRLMNQGNPGNANHEECPDCRTFGCKPVEEPREGTYQDFANQVMTNPEYFDFLQESATIETRETSATGGQKGSKDARIGSLDPRALMEVAKVAGFGEIKYERLNYMKGYEWSLSYDAMQRHLHAFWSGEDLDPESGLPHLAHAAWHCLALMAFMREHPNYDNRYKTSVNAKPRIPDGPVDGL